MCPEKIVHRPTRAFGAHSDHVSSVVLKLWVSLQHSLKKLDGEGDLGLDQGSCEEQMCLLTIIPE